MAENEKKIPEAADSAEKQTETAAAKTEVVKAEKKTPGKVKKPSRILAWFRTTKAEMKKIVWTPRKTVVKNTILTLVCMVLLGAIIGILDFVFTQAIDGLGMIF